MKNKIQETMERGVDRFNNGVHGDVNSPVAMSTEHSKKWFKAHQQGKAEGVERMRKHSIKLCKENVPYVTGDQDRLISDLQQPLTE